LSKAKLALRLTTDDVDKAVEEAQAALDAAKADAVLAEQEFTRFTSLFKKDAVPLRRSQEVTRARDAAVAQQKAAEAKLANAESNRMKIDSATRDVEVADATHQKADSSTALAETGYAQIHEAELLTAVKRDSVEEARRSLQAAEDQLKYTQVRAPFPGVIVHRFRNLGDFASAGVAILSLYNPDLLYVTANLEETRLSGVAPGNTVELEIDAFEKPFAGRVVWINKSTGAQFALMPRNVVSGEFTKVVQRVPVRIQIERDDRWPMLRAGLSVHVSIAHGPGDAAWADSAAREMRDLESRYNEPQQ
jgi:membrane fusion protein, multidrug efflux system